ncbi:hypothetical protein [Corynebacterium crudilactis]|nr:hypothetical protein [Corynebacterium crudilactis]
MRYQLSGIPVPNHHNRHCFDINSDEVVSDNGPAITDKGHKVIATAAVELVDSGDVVIGKGFSCLGGRGVGHCVSAVYVTI